MRNKTTFALASAAIAALTLAGCSADSGDNTSENSGGGNGGGESVSIQLASTWGPGTPYGESLQMFEEQVEAASDGRIDIEIFWDGSLVPGDDVLQAVGQGRAQMGYLNNSYFPTQLPLFQYVSIPFHSTDMNAAQVAWNDLLENNEEFQNEWSDNGVVNLGVQAVTPMIMSGPDVPTDMSWLKNKSIRATSYTGQAVAAAGGSPVALTVNELYESIQRGVVQGYTSMNFGTVPSLSLEEVSPFIADPGIGIYSTVAIVVNEQFFNSLSDEDQEILRTAGNDFNQNYLDVVDRVEDEACEIVIAAGGGVSIWDDAAVSEWQDLIGDDLLNQWKEDVERAGLDADAFIDAYTAAYEANASDSSDGALERCASK